VTAGGAGLCDACAHARVVTSARGSTFSLCALSVADPRLPRYPRLPVVRCPGFERRAAETEAPPLRPRVPGSGGAPSPRSAGEGSDRHA